MFDMHSNVKLDTYIMSYLCEQQTNSEVRRDDLKQQFGTYMNTSDG